MLWDEPKIFFLERRYFFSIILSEFLKNRVALQPFGKFPLPFLTLVKGKNIRQQNSGDVLDLMLRDAAVVGELFPPAQVAPPKKYFAAAFSRAAEEWRLERLLSSVPLFPSHPSPFLSENENAAACQAFRPVCVCMVS